ncbi:MAG TPA: DUF58 domain-containing protein [Candidatus Sumerlaeota bacterium]|nr:MAG: hypothetical protein BWY12_02157 [candidate division BRC1 bacterium ADurb.Bin183]HOE62850.1 DUF58 domain-containing protein [Candidatus Sumerlaeota bacterium]HRR29763.1 DUF58 domain-containing protein [Candidatus Sumerlaeia bacterium]HON50200.1 DUF58 domain-containing protein [Candidatus Sumerlaeota bacterium]HOR63416.1 DUF58 domain-containing protein [Candidatus Sumerlaeota bacterium]
MNTTTTIDTSEVLKKVRRIEIVTRRFVNDVMAGEYHSVFKGRGMEFDEVREYQQGDDIRTIDWNVTARTGSPHVKRYVEERELTVMLMVDASSSGRFGTTRWQKGEMATELCAVLAFSAIKNNDRVGLMIFTDQIEKFIPPKKGRRHVLRVIREIIAFRPTRGRTNLTVALDYINNILTRKSVVFLISDFFNNDIRSALAITNKRHDLIAVSINDPRETRLPAAGIIEFEDAETGELVALDTSSLGVRTSFEGMASIERQEMTALLRSLNIDHIALSTSEDYTIPLIRFFRERAKRF